MVLAARLVPAGGRQAGQRVGRTTVATTASVPPRFAQQQQFVGFVEKVKEMMILGQPITSIPAILTLSCLQRTAPVTALEATLRAAEQGSTSLWRSDERA